MERIELFDNYLNNQLSDEQRSEFDARLKCDEDFASDFKVYLLTVNGICREAQQDNMDFGHAMKGLTEEQLKEIIGRQSQPFSREDVVDRLRANIIIASSSIQELSGAAALNEIDDDDYKDIGTSAKDNKSKKKTYDLPRLLVVIFIALIILLFLLVIIC